MPPRARTSPTVATTMARSSVYCSSGVMANRQEPVALRWPSPRAQTTRYGRALLRRRAGRLTRQAYDDRLDVDELADAEDAQLATVAAAFDAAERQARIGRHHAVDEYVARLDATRELLAAFDVPRPQGSPETVLRVIGQADGIERVARADDGGDRTERFFAKRGHVGTHAVQHGRGIKIAFAVERVAANHGVRAARDRALDLVRQRIPKVLAGQGSNIRVALHRVADAQRLDRGCEVLSELVGNGVFDDEPLGGDAALTVVLVAGAHGGRDGAIQVRFGEDDEGIGTAELEDLFLDLTAGCAGDTLADIARAGQGDCVDARVGDERLDFAARDQHRTEQARRQTGAGEDLLNRQRAAGHVRGMLQNGAVTCHERRGGKPKNLPERKVPGHDRQHHPERLKRDEAVAGVG